MDALRAADSDAEIPREFDDYAIVRELGRGAMGRVFLAEDTVLARMVAIKFIAGVDPDLAARRRFLLEARAAARIQHPNVVGVYRVGELDDRPYIVSELVRGRPLSDVPLPLAPPAALALAIELARGLAAAHRRGVVHCDIKPANVMVDDDGHGKLVDFGLARVLHDGHDAAQGPPTGTPAYMAPEVWGGQAPSRRADVYSLGAVIYELLAGEPPWGQLSGEALAAAACSRTAPSLAIAALGLGEVVARCLARVAADRYASGEELREALERLAAARTGAISVGDNPYRGLRPFEAAHRGLFFGRGLEVSTLVERLRTEAVVVVTGDSGVGKSSLCRAGVLPAIADGALGDGQTWRAISMTPGKRPLAALAHALGDPALAARLAEDPTQLPRLVLAGGPAILFVDQLEELVTIGDPAEVAALSAGLARLASGATGVRIVATARADFLTKLAALPDFGHELSRVLSFVGPLPPERLRDVITGPAAATGVRFGSEALVDELIAATAEAGSGGLPLLSFALAELWEARDRERAVIEESAAAAMGGVGGALARHGDAVLAGLGRDERGQVRRLLLRLVTSVGTRTRRAISELAADDASRAALDALTRSRLVVVQDGDDGPTCELAHEVLISGWATLRTWLAADTDDRARREQLAAAAATWAKSGRRADATWRGKALVEALALDPSYLSPLDLEFVAASRRAARRARWWRRSAVAGAVLLAAGVLAGERMASARDLAKRVEAELAEAHADLSDAEAAEHHARELARTAYDRFDAGDAQIAEDTWAHATSADGIAERAYRAASASAEAAFALDPTRGDARALVAHALFARAELADAHGQREMRDEQLARLAAYDDDGALRARWAAPGTLVVRAPDDAELSLEPTTGPARALGHGDVTEELPAGSYVVVVRSPDHAEVRAPVVVVRGERVELPIAPPPAADVPAGFAYVPAGSFLYGSSAPDDARTSFFSAAPIHARRTDAFLIARTEVRVGDWLAYAAVSHVLPDIPAKLTGAVRITAGGARYEVQPMQHAYTAAAGEPLSIPGRARRAVQDWQRLPVTGITADQAAAYAAWLDTTGRVPGARLCDELEWERAGRGADGREYPSGDHLADDDANIDATYGHDAMGPDEVGSHPASSSPFGVDDMSGNAFEWTRAEHGGFVLRGGSFFHDRKTANLANRAPVPAGTADATIGVRICATPKSSSDAIASPTTDRKPVESVQR